MSNNNELKCSFCGKKRSQVSKLVAGPEVYICSSCIEISHNIIVEELSEKRDSDIESRTIPSPSEIKLFLDKYIVGHDAAKEMLSVSAYNHYKRIYLDFDELEIEKSNILLVGPTGSGKTLFAKTLAKKLDVPFIIADATSLTEAGYVGDDVELLLDRLLQAADYDVDMAQRGIIYIDEIDKKAKKDFGGSTARDISGEGVQHSLLRIIEGTSTKVRLNKSRKMQEEYVNFDTNNILFILGGSFVGIEKDIEKRTTNSSIGFSANVYTQSDRKEILSRVTTEDVISFGIIPELMGRVPILGVLDELSVDHLRHILTEVKNSPVEQCIALLEKDNIELIFSEEYLNTVAELAYKKNLGARALKSILEESLIPIMYNAPDLQNQGVSKIVFDKYPVGSEKPILVYDSGKKEDYNTYKPYRGKNEALRAKK